MRSVECEVRSVKCYMNDELFRIIPLDFIEKDMVIPLDFLGKHAIIPLDFIISCCICRLINKLLVKS